MAEARSRSWVAVGAIGAGLGVAIGAFGAHGLRGRISPELLDIFRTGAQYQLLHALAILLVAALFGRDLANRSLHAAAFCFLSGTVFFSGSLYLLALTGARAWGAVTPAGGAFFLAGWAFLALAGIRSPR